MNSLNSTCNLSEFSLTRLIPWLFAVEFAAFGYKVRIWPKYLPILGIPIEGQFWTHRTLKHKLFTSAHCQKWTLCFRIDLAVFHDIFHPFRNIFFWIYLSMIPIFWPPRWFELDNPFHTQQCVRTRICTSRWMNMCKSTEFTLTPEFQSEDYRKDRFKYYYVIVLEYE